jgi:hypothetical protein
MSLSLQLPSTHSEVGIDLSGVELSYDQWEQYAQNAIGVQEKVQWVLGDILSYGFEKYTTDYSDRLVKFGAKLANLNHSKAQLYNYTYVSNKVPISVRTEKLSWTHHWIVAPLSVEDQRKYLALAVENEWSKEALKAALKKAKKVEGACEENTTQPTFSPFAWMNDAVREFRNACEEIPIHEWENERIMIVWDGLLEVAKTVGGPIKSEIDRRGLRVEA